MCTYMYTGVQCMYVHVYCTLYMSAHIHEDSKLFLDFPMCYTMMYCTVWCTLYITFIYSTSHVLAERKTL